MSPSPEQVSAGAKLDFSKSEYFQKATSESAQGKRFPGKGDPTEVFSEVFMHSAIPADTKDVVTNFTQLPNNLSEIRMLITQALFGTEVIGESDITQKGLDAIRTCISLSESHGELNVPHILEKIKNISQKVGVPEHSIRRLFSEAATTTLLANDLLIAAKKKYFASRREHGIGGSLDNKELKVTLSYVVQQLGETFKPNPDHAFIGESQAIEQLSEKIKTDFLQRWSTTSGYSSIHEYRTDLERAPEEIRLIARKLREGDFALTANLREQDLESVMANGCKNIYETGTGTYARGPIPSARQHYVVTRFSKEARMLGITANDYHNVPVADRPKYFAAEGMSNLSRTPGNTQYGTSWVAVRARDVFGRAFLTVGDSLNTQAAADKPWDNGLIPVEYADVLAPLIWDAANRQWKEQWAKMHPQLKTQELERKVGIVISYDDGRNIDTGVHKNFPPPLEKLKVTVHPYDDSIFGRAMNAVRYTYVESQIFGPVPPTLFIAHKK